jgi:hypothetical protein
VFLSNQDPASYPTLFVRSHWQARLPGSWCGSNVCVKSPRSRAIVPTESGLFPGAPISMAQQSLLISVSTTMVHHSCSQVSTSSSYSESLSKLQLMAACGLAQRSESRMGGRTGRTIHPQRGWASRSRCPVLVTTKPTPESLSCSSASWKTPVRQIQHAHAHAQVELWAMDEHRVGLKPLIRRAWAWHPDIARSFVCTNTMNGSTCMDFFIPKQERANGCWCRSREYRGLQPCLSALCTGCSGWS